MRAGVITGICIRTVLYLALILGAAGCNLPERTVVTATPGPSPSPAATAPSGSVPPAQESCVAPVDWPEYTVQPGDTLTRIVDLTGSTIEELVAANCLENPDRLERGQTLRVPRLPGEEG